MRRLKGAHYRLRRSRLPAGDRVLLRDRFGVWQENVTSGHMDGDGPQGVGAICRTTRRTPIFEPGAWLMSWLRCSSASGWASPDEAQTGLAISFVSVGSLDTHGDQPYRI